MVQKVAGFPGSGRGLAGGRLLWRPAVLLVLLLSAGCAGRPHGILVPVAGTVPGASRVDMLVATTRGRDEDPTEMFGGDRASEASFAAVTVSIPPDQNRKIG